MTEWYEKVSERTANFRKPHSDVPLSESDLDPDPFRLFTLWLEKALDAHPGWPNAMTLATADATGRPSARMVLLKGVDEKGFTFFTNYDSRKGRDLEQNPYAALVFHWPVLERQVRSEGPVVKLRRGESEEYFRTRPLGSRHAAWASPQSSVVPGRDVLEEGLAEAGELFGEDVPIPPRWGGYRLTPEVFEFWQSRKNRLHDRFRYRRTAGGWKIERLAP
ncbi:MAG: pyridoxamine 5'-phosphate oxidase [Actinomycetota bacterium]